MTTRHNLCPNPGVGANTTGWAGTAGPAARVTGISNMPVTTAARYTGTGYIQTPTGAASPGLAYTMSAYVTNNTGFSISGKTIFFTFTRSAGGDDFSQTFTMPTIASGATGRVSQTFTSPALATGMYWIIDTLNGGTGTGIDISAALYEQAAALDTYFDGNTANATWDGTAENSTSTLSTTLASAAPTGIAIPISLGSPTVSLAGVTPTGLAIPVSLGSPSTVAPVIPTGIAIPIALGSPSVGSTVSTLSTGSWWGLAATAALNRSYDVVERQIPPVACPNDGEPLELINGKLHCRYDGWIDQGWNRL